MTEEHEYILGTDRDELTRLGEQHEAWRGELQALLRHAGLAPGQVVIDLGCGPGFTTFDLAEVVGPSGRVIARDQSARFLKWLQSEVQQRGLSQVEVSLGPAEQLGLAPATLDGAYARWLLCWLSDPAAVLREVAFSLKTAGFFVIQDYLDWGAMSLVPSSKVFSRSIDACCASWQAGEGDIDVLRRLPLLAAAADLRVEAFRPQAHLAPPGSAKWRWLEGFFQGYLPKLVERGFLAADELREHHEEWAHRADQGKTYAYTPVLADVILRKD